MSEVNTDTIAEQHGGNLSWIARHYPQAPHPLIDLSTCVNPYAYPLPPIEPAWLHRLADAQEVEAAQAAAAAYYGAQDAGCVALASGMQPLIFALACLRLKEAGTSEVAVLSPAYGEHARVWRAVGHCVAAVENIAELPQRGVVILASPNNPDGRVISPQALHTLAGQLKAQGGWLIVDASFADLLPDYGNAVSGDNCAVLHSCGKFFGVAGLRASAAVATPPWASWLHLASGPWPLSTAACRLLPAMLGNESWIGAMRRQLAEEAEQWRGLLSQHFTLVGHTPLFTLVETPAARRWQEHLAAQGIWVRIFDYNSRRLRFGLPDRAHMPRIQAALSEGI